MLKNILSPMTSDPNFHLLRTSDVSICTAYRQAGLTAQEPIVAMDTSLESDNEGPLSLLIQKLVPAPSLDLSESYLLASPQVRYMMRQMAQEEAVRIHATRVDPFLSQTQR